MIAYSNYYNYFTEGESLLLTMIFSLSDIIFILNIQTISRAVDKREYLVIFIDKLYI